MNYSTPSSACSLLKKEDLMITWHLATEFDLNLLAEWNHQLIRDEGHRNPMTVPELRQRMAGWLALDRGTKVESFQEAGSAETRTIPAEYVSVIFSRQGQPVAYALYRETRDEIYLRQFFVRRDMRRQGIGRRAFQFLREEIWSNSKRLTVEVLVANTAGTAFWRSLGYQDYCLMLEILPVKKISPTSRQ